jgi:Uma2 family endonuclease
MAHSTKSLDPRTFADVLHQLGDIPPQRVLADPPPGRATERDLLRLLDHSGRLYELVDGVLVEKVVGFAESFLAARLIKLLSNWVDDRGLGIVSGADGPMKLMPKMVRLPDVSFVSWERLPGRAVPSAPIPDLAPDLAVEVLSEGNTKGEMERKLKEYFLAGVRLVWIIDPPRRRVTAYTAPDESTVVGEDESLTGGEVLPGLSLPLRDVFALLPSAAKKPRRKRT